VKLDRKKGESKVKINCLGCGYKVDLSGAYDNYEGPIKCFACGAVMEIATQHGNLRAVVPVTLLPLPSAEEILEPSRL
jgi:DNA-directed RNA polymerase subunit N (RpoN/RPB10)